LRAFGFWLRTWIGDLESRLETTRAGSREGARKYLGRRCD
jgi:hypothetical protein